MKPHFFKKIEELLHVGTKYCEDVNYLINNYKAYEEFLSPTDYQHLENAILKYYKPLPNDIFEGLSCPDNKLRDVVEFLKIITSEFKQKLAPSLYHFSGASVSADYEIVTNIVARANRKNSDLPNLEDGLAAPFQSITRYKLLFDDIQKIISTEQSSIKPAVAECQAVIKEITDTMNSTIRGIEKIKDLFNIKSDSLVDKSDLAKGVLQQGTHIKVNRLIAELTALIEESEEPTKKEELIEWLHEYFIQHIYKQNTGKFEDKSKYLELLLTTIESNFNRDQLHTLTGIIVDINKELPSDIHATEELCHVADKLSLKFAEPKNRNAHFIGFIAQLFSPFSSPTSNASENKLPMLGELIDLIELTNELEDKEELRAEKAAERKRQARDISSIAFDDEAKGLLNVAKGEESDYSSAENARHEAHRRVLELSREIEILDAEIAALKEPIADLEEKKQNLAYLHAQRTYKKKFPLHAAVQQANIAEVVSLLTSDKAAEHNKPDDAGLSPIYHAYEQGYTQIFQLLYEGIGPTPEEKEQYKTLIERNYEQLASKKGKGTLNDNDLALLESFREMAMLFKAPYSKLWNDIDPAIQEHEACDAQRVINILKDYYAPACLSVLNWPFAQRFLTKHMGRHSINLKKAEDLSKDFQKFFIPLDAPDNLLTDRKPWSFNEAIRLLNEAKNNHALLSIYNSEGSFSQRLTYMLSQLTMQNSLTHSQSADNLEAYNSQRHHNSSSTTSFNSSLRLSFYSQRNDNSSNNKREEPSSSCIIS